MPVCNIQRCRPHQLLVSDVLGGENSFDKLIPSYTYRANASSTCCLTNFNSADAPSESSFNGSSLHSPYESERVNPTGVSAIVTFESCYVVFLIGYHSPSGLLQIT
jgi:hypothetical protein